MAVERERCLSGILPIVVGDWTVLGARRGLSVGPFSPVSWETVGVD